MTEESIWEAAWCDPAGTAVLCDYLLEQGDPRGEIIAMLTRESRELPGGGLGPCLESFELSSGALGPCFRVVLDAKRKATGGWGRHDEHIHRLNGWFKVKYGAASPWESEQAFASVRWQLDEPRDFQFPVEPFSPANGFTYAGVPSASIEVLESPYLREGEAVILNGQAFRAPVLDEHDVHLSAHALALAINARPEVGVSAREIDGHVVLASTPAGRMSLVQQMLDHGMLGDGAMRMVWDQSKVPIGLPYERPIDLRSPRQKKRQAAAALRGARPQRRLDGRRAR